MTQYLLSFIIFTPLLGVLLLLILPEKHVKSRIIALGAVLLQMIFTVMLFIFFQSGKGAPAGVLREGDFQFIEKVRWIWLDLGNWGNLAIDYFVGIDGINLPMVVLASIVLVIGAISSWNITQRPKAYFSLYLILSSAIIGCFMALDFFLFYLFFEFMLLPMYFLIGMWGGPRREYASIKFFLYTLAGSVFILIVMIGLYISVIDPVETAINIGVISNAAEASPELIEKVQRLLFNHKIAPADMVHTFNMISMTESKNFVPGSILGFSQAVHIFGSSPRLLAFLFLFIGFAIKLPAVPFHTWLPDAHVEAPTPISVVLAGILLKIGGYGLMRTAYPIFPDGAVHFAWWIGLLGVISIIYGGLNALAQKDIKKLIAYSSVSHMGFVLLGLSSLTVEGISGAMYQMFSHGIITCMLFLIAGVIYDRTHDRLIENYKGLASVMPRFTVVVVIAFFASLGLPGFSGFISELLVFLGAFNSFAVNQLLPRWMTMVAALGLVISAGYYLWTLQRMFMGKFAVRQPFWKESLKDLSSREYLMFVPLIILTVLLGVMPNLYLDFVNNSVNEFVIAVSKTGTENLMVLFK